MDIKSVIPAESRGPENSLESWQGENAMSVTSHHRPLIKTWIQDGKVISEN